MNPPRNETRFWTLDVLRGVCAGVVFLSHWHLWSRFAPQGPVEATLHRLFDFLLLGTWLLLQLGWRDYGVQLAVTFSLSITVVLVVYYRVERVFYRPRSRPIAAALTTGSVPA